uniref:Uncharacterized protein n=1 Tax=Arundo donax TaxID=35708 RepID=A0A0A9HME4_ARUDO
MEAHSQRSSDRKQNTKHSGIYT